MPKVEVSIAHRLSRKEAKRRIASLIDQVQELGGVWSQRWQDAHRLAFEILMHGSTVNGTVLVKKGAVDIDVELPLTLVLLATRVKNSMETAAQKALSSR